jgi:nitrate reductase NapE
LPDSHETYRPAPARGRSRLHEVLLFLLLAFAIWPILSVGFVAAYGFLIWFYQMFAGPPGPPTGH